MLLFYYHYYDPKIGIWEWEKDSFDTICQMEKRKIKVSIICFQFRKLEIIIMYTAPGNATIVSFQKSIKIK